MPPGTKFPFVVCYSCSERSGRHLIGCLLLLFLVLIASMAGSCLPNGQADGGAHSDAGHDYVEAGHIPDSYLAESVLFSMCGVPGLFAEMEPDTGRVTLFGDCHLRSEQNMLQFVFYQIAVVTGNVFIDRISKVEVPGLIEVRGSLYSDAFVEMQAFSLPHLTSVRGNFSVSQNPNLEELLLPDLRLIGGDFDVANNPMLPQCAIDSIVASLEINGETNVAENCQACVCH